ncbi:MAG TPA: hypothetical protein VFU07_00990 [Candidatus Lumbricidophila sp.]|nr:hypothetical protein [Candidatus Lumbricidophila sp.]
MSLLARIAVTPTPTPSGAPEFDPNQVTPGPWGFVITFAVMAFVVLVLLDMVRRIRRVNYRAQIAAQLDAEEAAAAEGDVADGAAEASGIFDGDVAGHPESHGDAERDGDAPRG